MLPTEKATWPNCIWLGRISGQLRLDTSYNYSPKSIEPFDNSMLPQHLYLLSDEEIKVGDLCYSVNFKGTQFGRMAKESLSEAKRLKVPKVVASTDSSLPVPTFSKSFLEVFVKEYNKGNIITEVMVEYEYIPGGRIEAAPDIWEKGYGLQLKVKSDNTISIRKIKDSWNREEVDRILEDFSKHCFKIAKEAVIWAENYPIIIKKEWIKENL